MDRTITIGGIDFNLKLSLMIIITTIVPLLDAYNHTIFERVAYNRFVFYFIVPVFFIVVVFRDDIRDYGFKIGNWREGMAWTLSVCIVMGTFLYFFARTPAMQEYYEIRAADNIPTIIWLAGVELFAWEFVWRGFLLYGLARYLGPGPAIFLQAVPFAFMHLGKPEIETLSTIFGGAGFGFVAWRTHSFIYPWFIHWFMAAFVPIVAAGLIS